MEEKEIVAAIEAAEAGKILVADLIAKATSDEERESVVGMIDSLTHLNVIKVLRDKDLKRFVARLTGKIEYDLSEKPGASKDQIEAFTAAAFEFPDAYVTNFATHRRYSFKIVKLAGKKFADVFTPEGKQAGFIKYVTSTVHPWYQDIGENHWVLQFTTIGEGKNIIDKETGISYWINHDFYQEAFGDLRKNDGFQMKSMQGLVKMVINKMYPELKDSEGKTIRRPSLRIRVNSIGLSTYNNKEIDQDINFGDAVAHLHKDAANEEEAYPALTLTVDGQEVAKSWFRGFRTSDNFFESDVRVLNAGNLVPSEIISEMTKVMEENSKVSLGSAFERL